MTSKLCIALALAGALSAAACGGRPQPPRMGGPGGGPGGPGGGFSGLIAQPVALLFSDFDADRDRRVMRAEVDRGVDAAWLSLDRNGDGVASALEFADWAKVVMGSETATPGRIAMDADADGSLSSAEVRNGLLAEFDRLDSNDDDALDRSELVRMLERGGMGMMGPEGETFILRRGGPGGGQGGSGGPGGGMPSGEKTDADETG
jgi:hypothetical protein